MTRLLARPRRVGLGGLGDPADPFDFSNLDFSFDPGAVPTTAGGAIDFRNFDFPDAPAATPSGGSLRDAWEGPPRRSSFDFSKLASDVVKGAQTYYGATAAVNNANYAAQLAKAQGQGAVNLAKAQAANAAKTAGAGLPSPTLLLAAGVGLAAVLLLKR